MRARTPFIPKYHPLKRRANPAGFRVAPVVSALMTLQPGRYTIVPSTYEVSTEPSIFILEVYCSGTANFENEGDEVRPQSLHCCHRRYHLGTVPSCLSSSSSPPPPPPL